MDSGDFIYLIFFVLWLFGQIAAVRKKHQQRQLEKQRAAAAQGAPAAPQQSPTRPAPPPVLPGPQRPRVVSPSPGERLLTSLSDLGAEIAATLPELDERVRAQVSYLVDNDFQDKTRDLQIELRNESASEFARAAQETQWLASHYRGVLQTARVHSGLRQRRELAGAQAVADGLVTELDHPRNVVAALPPPVAIVWDVAANDRLRESALADSTLFVPRTVVQDASHWSLMAPEIARYLGASAPALYQDIYEGLELRVDEAQVGNDPQALTRVLFGSWIGRIVADAVGALFFGPAYLLSVAQLYAQPQAPARVTSIVLNQDGTVGAEPPVHVRVHVIGEWVARMGYASEATPIVRDWDERHGSPSALGFWGSMTSLPAGPVLDVAKELTDILFQLPLEAFGNVRLAHVPGLSGWESHAREATEAKASLLSGARAQGAARAIVAGAIVAALEKPEANATLNAALYESITGIAMRPTPSIVTQPRAHAPKLVPTSQRPIVDLAELTARDVGEALILGEIVL